MTEELPPGALTVEQGLELRVANSKKTVYMVTQYDLSSLPARWLNFNCSPPGRYFLNFWHAYAYAIRLGIKDPLEKMRK